jgi:hypothetical protein
MSTTIIHDFFPDIGNVVQKHLGFVWNMAFPPHLQQQCPEPFWIPADAHDMPAALMAVLPETIRLPWLIPFCVLGVVVGLRGFLQLRKQRSTSLFAMAAFFFACMNTAAIHCHCLTWPGAYGHTLSKALDVGFTCASSLHLILAVLDKRQPHIVKGVDLHRIALRVAFVAITLAIVSNYVGMPWINEALYIGTTILAAGALFLYETLDFTTSAPARAWMQFACFGILIGLSGIPLDRRICVNHVHLLFLGCDLAFLGVIQYGKICYQYQRMSQKQK